MSGVDPFPIGWYRLLPSDELEAGEPRPVTALGRELVAWRTGAGVHVADARCPHLGAHLGHGGRVIADCLQCPFHGWRFAADGVGTDRTGHPIPARARLRTYPAVEVDGVVAFFHGDDDRPPTWAVEPLDVDPLVWTPARVRAWTVRTQVQVVNENAHDAAHHPVAHDATVDPTMTRQARGPLMEGEVSMTYTLDGFADAAISVLALRQQGLGCTSFDQRTRFGDLEVVQRGSMWITPIDEQHVAITMGVHTRRYDTVELTDMVEDLVCHYVFAAVEQDIAIWEHLPTRSTSTGEAHPAEVLTAADRPLVEFRRWAAQFDRVGEEAR